MADKLEIKAVDMVRRIRDEQAQVLAGKSNAEIMAFFRIAGQTARQKANSRQAARSQSPAHGLQCHERDR